MVRPAVKSIFDHPATKGLRQPDVFSVSVLCITVERSNECGVSVVCTVLLSVLR